MLDYQDGRRVLTLRPDLRQHRSRSAWTRANVFGYASKMLLCADRQRGFTLVELMIGVVIIGILILTGAPSFSAWIQNTQIRNAAEAILNGMQLARTEAVNRNAATRFVLCSGTTSAWEILATSTAVAAPTASLACGAGSNAQAGEERVQERSASQGSGNTQVQVMPGGARAVTFNSMGRVVANTFGDAGSASITQVNVSNPKGNRPLRITVSTGGSLRMCDPSLATGTDPRAC